MFARALLLATIFLVLIPLGPALAADLTIAVTGLRNADGLVRLAIFDKASEFPEGEELKSRDVPARAVALTVHFTGLKPGRYAVAMHHDENGNKKMDSYIFGIPKEGYGFSRDAPVFFGPPGFDRAAVTLPPRGLAIEIEVRY